MVRPKKHLGQHFLTDQHYAQKIVAALSKNPTSSILEIGPGTGVLTKYILESGCLERYYLSEIDSESVEYLNENYPELSDRIFEEDFLKMNFNTISENSNISIIGNFPYNISSQILFKVYDEIDRVDEVVGMFQKEVAKRVAAPPGNKEYGILSVLLQAFYDIQYLFSVPPGAFFPPPKVQSGVIRLVRNPEKGISCDQANFTAVVKTAFNQRRKTLRNALRPIWEPMGITSFPFEDKRAEQLTYKDFEQLTIHFYGAK